jgi:hypothetical protein
MSALNAWKQGQGGAGLTGIRELPVSPHFLPHSDVTHALRRGADLATVRIPQVLRRLRRPAVTCALGQKNPAAIARAMRCAGSKAHRLA